MRLNMLTKTLIAAAVGSVLITNASAVELETEAQKLSYIFGNDIGKTLESQGIELDFKALVAGIETGYKGGEAAMSAEDINTTRQSFIERKTAEAKAQVVEMATTNAAEGKAFLVENGKKDGVVTTASGLQYIVVDAGKGAKPKAEDIVTVHYRGTTLNGQEFDSSYKRNAPASFPLNRVIPGWTEGLQLMSVGSKFKFFIPSALAYGETGSAPTIMPNATLVFDVELISIGEDK